MKLENGLKKLGFKSSGDAPFSIMKLAKGLVAERPGSRRRAPPRWLLAQGGRDCEWLGAQAQATPPPVPDTPERQGQLPRPGSHFSFSQECFMQSIVSKFVGRVDDILIYAGSCLDLRLYTIEYTDILQTAWQLLRVCALHPIPPLSPPILALRLRTTACLRHS